MGNSEFAGMRSSNVPGDTARSDNGFKLGSRRSVATPPATPKTAGFI